MALPSWALPTTGNLADDDYRRSMNAWMKAHPYTGNEQYDSRGVQDLVSGGIDDISNLNPERDAWAAEQMKAYFAQLTPEQRAERERLYAAASAKRGRNGRLAALAAFGGIAGAGMLGAGMLGSGLAGASGAAAGGDLGMAGWMGAGAGEMGLEAGAAGLASSAAAGGGAAASSPWSSFLSGILKNVGTKAGGNLLSQLISAGGNAYMGNKQAGQYDDVINQINQLYAPDSAYAKQMQQTLARKDAAAGRNSQYGSRAVELAANLTQAKSNALTSSGYGNLLAQRGTNQNIPWNGFLAAAGSGAGQDLITRAGSGLGHYISNFFGSEGEKYSPTQPNTGFDNDWMLDYAPG